MNDILNLVTPDSRGIIWFSKQPFNIRTQKYSDIEYLSNGLLSSTLSNTNEFPSHLIVSESFGKAFFIFVIKEVNLSEIESFINYIATQLNGEDNLLLIDETGDSNNFLKTLPESLSGKVKLLSQ